MIQTRQLILIIGVLAAGTTGAYHWGQSNRTPPKSAVVQVPSDIPNEESVRESSTVDLTQKPAFIAASARPLIAEPPGEPSPRSPQRDVPSLPDQAAHTDVIFSNQKTDSRWAFATARQLDEGLRSTNPTGSRVQSVECRTDLCKAVITHDDEAQFRLFSDKISTGTIWEGAFTLVRDSNPTSGSVRSMMFFAKPGVELPILE